MAHFAQLDQNNIVTQVIVISNNDCIDATGNENEAVGAGFCASLFGGVWKQTSYNGKIRKNYAGIGYKYDPVLDAFIPPQPFQSWILNNEKCQWQAPIPMPQDGKFYIWNEDNQSWIEVT